jgi:hypothetical protein
MVKNFELQVAKWLLLSLNFKLCKFERKFFELNPAMTCFCALCYSIVLICMSQQRRDLKKFAQKTHSYITEPLDLRFGTLLFTIE